MTRQRRCSDKYFQWGLALATCPRSLIWFPSCRITTGTCVANGSGPLLDTTIANGYARMKASAVAVSSTRKCSGMYTSFAALLGLVDLTRWCCALTRRLHSFTVSRFEGRCIPGDRILETNVQYLLYFGNDNSLLVFHFDGEFRLILRERPQFFPNLVQLRIAQPEFRPHRSFARLAIADARRLVPYDIIASQVCHQH